MSTPTKLVRVIQIYFDEKSRGNLEPGFSHFFNEGNPKPFFENSVIEKHFLEGIEDDFIGFTSWKFRRKTYNQIEPEELKKFVIEKNLDAVLYLPERFPAYKLDHFWQRNYSFGSEIKRIAQDINAAGILPIPDLFQAPWIFNYCNFWIVKNRIFQEFCSEWLIPVMNFFRIRPKYNFVKYRGRNYPIEPFVCEGLFGSFIGSGKISFTQAYDYFERTHKIIKVYA